MEEKTRAYNMGYRLMKGATQKEVIEGIKEFLNEFQDIRDYIDGVKTFEDEGKLPDSQKVSKHLENWWVREMIKKDHRKDIEMAKTELECTPNSRQVVKLTRLLEETHEKKTQDIHKGVQDKSLEGN